MRLGIDIGATWLRAVQWREGRLLALGQWRTPAPEALPELLHELRRHLDAPLDGLGVGFAAALDGSGVVCEWPNRPEYVGFEFFPLLGAFEAPPRATRVVDDCAAAAYGEHCGLAGGESSSTLYIGWGTGLGAGAVFDGRPHLGARSRAWGIGHTPVPSAATLLCRCGRIGCLQALVGGPVLEQRARSRGWQGEALGRAAAAGNALARSVISDAARELAAAVGKLAALLDPHRVVIGGGATEAGESALAPLRESFEQHAPGVPLQLARYASYSGAVGAALWTGQGAPGFDSHRLRWEHPRS
ncbi:MAG TPA: ROK family protein [Polyangiaceae bacterium]|nr:ROK family protein [Polyangiaceae bacterium]